MSAGKAAFIFVFLSGVIMSVEFFMRILGMVVFFVAGISLGAQLGDITGGPKDTYALLIGLLGALAGLILTPFLTTRPSRALRSQVARLSAQTLVAGLVGLVVGLIIAALLAFPLSLLPEPFRSILPFIGVLLFGYFGVAVFVMRQNDIFSAMRLSIPGRSGGDEGAQDGGNRTILLDTSVIIDGRIADIARTGFLTGTLLIPRFVLDELQFFADSADGLRRQRRRRGRGVLS